MANFNHLLKTKGWGWKCDEVEKSLFKKNKIHFHKFTGVCCWCRIYFYYAITLGISIISGIIFISEVCFIVCIFLSRATLVFNQMILIWKLDIKINCCAQTPRHLLSF